MNLNGVHHLCKCMKCWKIMQAAIRITSQSSSYVLVIKCILEASMNAIPTSVLLSSLLQISIDSLSSCFSFSCCLFCFSCEFLGATALSSRARKRSSRAVPWKLSVKTSKSSKEKFFFFSLIVLQISAPEVEWELSPVILLFPKMAFFPLSQEANQNITELYT